LDDWLTRFEGVHSLKHPGGGIAPWNVQQFEFHRQANKLMGMELSTGVLFPVIFFHFHGMKFFANALVKLTVEVYLLPKSAVNLIYNPYLKGALKVIEKNKQLFFFSKIPDSHLNKIFFLPLYFKIKIQYLIDTIKLKNYYRLFSGGNYFRNSKFE